MEESIGNPQSFYNGAISGQRNMFASSAMALAMAGFSHNFKNKNVVNLVQILSFLLFCISVYIGFTTSYNFTFYLDRVKDKLPSYIPIDNWYRTTYIVYLYVSIIAVLGSLFFVRKII